VNTSQTFKVKFHAEAAARIAELAKEVLSSVRSFGPIEPPPSAGAEIHPVAHIGPDEIIGEIKVRQSSFNGLGTEVGRYWISKGMRVGWEGREFEAIKDLAIRLGSLTSIKGRVSESFLLDEVFAWLSETLELKRGDELADYITERCSTEIKDYEIWVPVFRTYSTTHFKIGNVDFRTVSKAILDRSYGQLPDDVAKRPEVAIKINRERSRIQGSIAACTRARAEFKKAREVAQSAASEAIGLLRFLSPVNFTCRLVSHCRFLSPVNFTCRLVSHCLPVGRENTQRAMESVSEASVEQGPAGWNLDEARSHWPGILEFLDKLAALSGFDGFQKGSTRGSTAIFASFHRC